MRFSVSATTRPPRPHEREGVDYHFVSPERFRELVAEGELLEHEEVYPGRFYGTLRAEVERLAQDVPVLLDLEVKGALNVKRRFGEGALVLFVQPPSLEALEERLRARGTETAASLHERLERARAEMAYADRFDAAVVNDDLDRAVEETLRRVGSFLAS